ncbi:dephospho-CoA kinase [Legionella jamestowniensis]|uniref:Dephospho-CoA kinase n=1 Tax=Legionella jamestowniensis TaxID=455 RepID=A0A0W0UL51_9GAMM|nr:dephospho-CoA kinase [Legionella jamestowniensis]KTD08265.1 dephospho-CoA kinase [Legionella jamestowniensis]SFL97656.1 dephospho-CoA kinase [Legionella jamestowniensis DSM 19215]
MYCVGLTGGIASGKSTVASLFKNKRITVISADQVARELMQSDEQVQEKIVKQFGESILNSSKEIDRIKLRQIIFANPEQRLWLEQLLHPLIRQRIVELVHNSKSSYSIVEIPLLKERKSYPYLDRVIVVLAEPQEQIKRVMERDNCTQREAQAILAAQPSDAERIAIADDIIFNNTSLAALKLKVEALHQQYLRFASSAFEQD